MDLMRNDEDQKPKIVGECQKRNEWPKWKETIKIEINSLAKREEFGPVVQTHRNIKPIAYKWVFVRKWNENNKIVRYKAQLVA